MGNGRQARGGLVAVAILAVLAATACGASPSRACFGGRVHHALVLDATLELDGDEGLGHPESGGLGEDLDEVCGEDRAGGPEAMARMGLGDLPPPAV